jgi:MoaA/NifB/PqqE/SkfB family radical SAM enzyme
MRVCCTANASSVQDPDSTKKSGGGQIGVLRTADGSPANLNNSNLMEAWNNDYMRNVRKMMLRGEKPSSCLKCYKEEESGVQSKRNWETAYWVGQLGLDDIIGDTTEDGEVSPKIRYLDLRLGSKCQLACVMCSPHDSSGWVKEWTEMYPQIENTRLKESWSWENKGKAHGASYNWHMNNPVFWDQLYDQIPHMKQLYFAGGESTIIEEHYTLLEEVIRRGHAKKIELRYNSNAVELPDRLFKIWEQFREVKFHFSIDCFGEKNDYIRYPSKWDQLVENMQLLDNSPSHITVTTAVTVMALNIYYIPDMIKWKIQQDFKKFNAWPNGAGMINWHLAYWPPQLNVKVLPAWAKQMVRDKFEELFVWLEDHWQTVTGVSSANVDKEKFMSAGYGIKRLRSLLDFMDKEDWSERLPELQEWIHTVDRHRGLDFKQIFPEISGLLD